MTPAEMEAEEKRLARRRKRSLALALVLGAAVLLFYVLTVVKMGPAIFNRPL
ncbi:hypothetical protein [Arsenicitalea aurantiaca]|uniref:hypothetical protein n=1 Tax=Arsenicitalea aurantiaca TaxID=1783274 RepID=UPI001863F5ED|nr:hypothetical protein [Arsenicitalea aurantiaca]